MNELEVYFTSDDEDVQGFRRVLATDPVHDYMEAWWPPGHTIGFEHTLRMKSWSCPTLFPREGACAEFRGWREMSGCTGSRG